MDKLKILVAGSILSHILFFSLVSNCAFAQSFELTQIDTIGNVGLNCMLKLSPTGRPHILYNDFPDYQLKYAAYDGEMWNIYETGLYEQINDFEVDNLSNLHCSRAAYSTLKYLFINTDSAYAEIIDSTSDRYSDSELEFFSEIPKITCVKYHAPAYLLEFLKTDTEWQCDTVTSLPIAPSGLSYIIRDNVNHASCNGTGDRMLMYYTWTNSSLSIDTVYQDSFYTANSLDVTDDGKPMILFNEDNSHNYNMVLAENQNNTWSYSAVDTSIGYTGRYLVKYSEADQMPFVMFIESGDPNRSLSLGYRVDSTWVFEDIYSGDLRGFSFDIDLLGNIHLCFYIKEDGRDRLYYGIWQRITAIHERESEIPGILDFKIFPNPTNNNAIISFISLGEEKTYNCSVYDILGRIIFQNTINISSSRTGEHNIEIEHLSELNSGIFFISLSSGEYVQTKKITIVR